MRASLLLLTTAAAALAVVSAACFDWDGLLARCQDAHNCLGPDSGDGGDGGAIGDGGGDAGQDGGADGGGDGFSSRGTPCADPADCVTGACNGFCVCAFNSPCRDNNDCCLGQTCTPGLIMGTCTSDAVIGCAAKDTGCVPPGLCCSTCNTGSGMCDCSQNAARCSGGNDCCSASALCSQGKHCCEPPGTSCSLDDQCCSRVCRSNTCR